MPAATPGDWLPHEPPKLGGWGSEQMLVLSPLIYVTKVQKKSETTKLFRNFFRNIFASTHGAPCLSCQPPRYTILHFLMCARFRCVKKYRIFFEDS